MVLAVVGCSGKPDPGPVFDNEGAQDVSCMVHQTEQPGARYTERDMRNTGEVLALMRYYTTNGAKAYCDATPASDADKAWAQVYLNLGGTTEKVPAVVG
jgi:hypothetical protein